MRSDTSVKNEVDRLSWPISRLGEAIEALACKSTFSPQSAELPNPPQRHVWDDDEALAQWIEAATICLGIEAEPVQPSYAEIEPFLCSAGPALLRISRDVEPRFLALLGGRRRVVSVLRPDLAVSRLRPDVVRAALCRDLEAPLEVEVNQVLDAADVPIRRRRRARQAILRAQLHPVQFGTCWLLRLAPGTNLWSQIRHAHLWRYLPTFVGAHAVQYLLWLLSWYMIGRGSLHGRFDAGWLLAWALLLVALVPCRLLVTWSQGVLAIGTAGLLKQQLLYGALRLEPEEVRYQGAGQHLGRVIESQEVESLALNGGLLGVVTVIELLAAAAVLGAGVGGGGHTLLLFGWTVCIVLIGWRYFRHRRDWTVTRLGITHDLVERMVGHRTRLAQEARECWHDGEDQALEGYLHRSAALDRTAMLLSTLAPRGWLVLGLCGLAPAFVSGIGTPAALAVSLGGTLLAYRALGNLAVSLPHIAGAAIAWKQIASLLRAAVRPEAAGPTAFALMPGLKTRTSSDQPTVIETHDLVFRYPNRNVPVLEGCCLRVRAGDRLLLEGPSGAGKSTLASVLIGLNQPESGLLLLGGLDRHTLGIANWRRRVVTVPQFHENHLLTGTCAFNLLMGRRWPPQPDDIAEAETVCRALGLGDLLDRMPAGLLQMVGESGWQLSHGERSRLYIARALLQNPDFMVLDESFAALDPESLQRAAASTLERAATLLVIAHP